MTEEQNALDRAAESAEMRALKTECERSRVFRDALVKLMNGPGRNMEGWKQTWAHGYAKDAIEAGDAITPASRDAEVKALERKLEDAKQFAEEMRQTAVNLAEKLAEAVANEEGRDG